MIYKIFVFLLLGSYHVQGYSSYGNRIPVITNKYTTYNGDDEVYTNFNFSEISRNKGLYGGDFISPNSPFEIVYEWKFFEYDFPSVAARRVAIASGDYIPENILPLGLDVWNNRCFITTYRFKAGIPATLATVDLPSVDKDPILRPYPNMDFHASPTNPDCTKIMSVTRIYVDDCDRLWIIDSGLVELENQACQPKILVFDLDTDNLLFTYIIPSDQSKPDSFYNSILVDIRDGRCNEAFAYVADPWRNGLLVFNLAERRSWRIAHHFMISNPYACEHNFHTEIFFQWEDGIFGTALGLLDVLGDRLLYFHPMSSFDEFSVPTSLLQNETFWNEPKDINSQFRAFKKIGSRGDGSQSCTSAIDRDGVLFYTLVDQDAVGCWDTRKPLEPSNVRHVDQDHVSISFPIDLKVDKAAQQNIWVLANNLPIYSYSSMDFSQVNVRILRASTKDAVKGSVCDPKEKGD